MIRIENLTGINLGVQGENLSKTIEIDMSSWLAAWPDATICVMHKRWSEEIPYTVGTASVERPEGGSLELDGNTLLWHISADDTAVAGRGAVQIIARQNGVIAKSIVVPALVVASISDVDGPEPEPPEQMWLDRLEGIAQSAEDSVAQAQETLRDARRLLLNIFPDNIVYYGELPVIKDHVPCTALTLSNYTYLTAINSTYQIRAYPYPSDTTQKITYSSGNVDIATVSDTGLVTTLMPGEVRFTVRCGNNVRYLDMTILDDVLEDDPDEPGPGDVDPGEVPPDNPTEPPQDIETIPAYCTKLALSQYDWTGPKGSDFTLRAYPQPANTTARIYYTISVSGIVSISSTGTRHAVKVSLMQPGYTTISVRCGDVVKYVTITVTDDVLEDDPDEEGPGDIDQGDVPDDTPTPPIENIPCVSISLSNTDYTGPKGTTYKPTVYLYPANTTDIVSFSVIVDPGVVTVDPISGVISLIRKGRSLVEARCGSRVAYMSVTVTDDVLEDDPDEKGPQDIEAPPEE